MELAMERLFRKDMKGNYVGAGAAPFFRNVDEHELSKEQVRDHLLDDCISLGCVLSH